MDFPSLVVKPPKKSNFDLSRKFRSTMAPGALYPILTERLVPGDKINISVDTLVKTYPLLAPLMGQFKLQIDFFFTPARLYIPEWRMNMDTFGDREFTNFGLPFFRAPNGVNLSQTEISERARQAKVSSSHLMAFLGFPPDFVDLSHSSESAIVGTQRYNALPLLCYLDIFRNYYANRQEENFPVYVNDKEDIPTVDFVSLSDLDKVFSSLMTHPNNYAINDALEPIISRDFWIPWLNTWNTPLGGLMFKTYLPDSKNVILNAANFSTGAEASKVNVVDGSFTIDSFNLSSKLYKIHNLMQLAGPRYSEFVRSQYAVKSPISSNIPHFIGSTSSDVVFEDVVSTAESGSQELGTLAGRGKGYGNGQKHFFEANEFGYFQVIASLVPRVDYYQFAERYLLDTYAKDIFINEYNGLPFQDVLGSDLNAVSPVANNIQRTPWVDGTNPFKYAFGKQPAWTDYMTAVSTVRGDFSTDLRYWTLSRDMKARGGGIPRDTYSTAYVQPDLFNFAFADTSKTAQNFFTQFGISMFKKSNVSKRLMPTI